MLGTSSLSCCISPYIPLLTRIVGFMYSPFGLEENSSLWPSLRKGKDGRGEKEKRIASTDKHSEGDEEGVKGDEEGVKGTGTIGMKGGGSLCYGLSLSVTLKNSDFFGR